MAVVMRPRSTLAVSFTGVAFAAVALAAFAQEPGPAKQNDSAPFKLAVPSAQADGQLLPINLPTALALAQARPIDIQLAEQRLQQALALEQRANTLWLPTLLAGVDYTRHDGQLQAVEGTVFGTSKQSL